jgi:hypothetical protein
MKKNSLYLSLLLNLFTACSSSPASSDSGEWQYFSGRNTEASLERPLIYRAKVPASWQRITPPPSESIFDSRKPLSEFLIRSEDENSSLRLTLHNFPTNSIEQRVPPSAQICRWKRQFDYLDAVSINITPESRGGFAGLFFEASGIQNGIPMAVIGWSMQLTPEHYRTLAHSTHEISTQMQSDYTLKAVGSPDSILKHKNSLIAFAHSFELIHEIPSPL